MSEKTNSLNIRQTLLRKLLVVGTAGWAALIFMASSIPGSGVPSGFGSAAHYVEYAVFGALLRFLIATTPNHQEPTLSATAVASAYGVTDEVHQAFVPMRTPDPVDWVVDTLGALSGAGLAAVALRAFAQRKRQ